MPTKLRTASPADIPAIIRLQERIWEPTYRNILSPEQIQYMFEQIYAPDALLAQMNAGHTFVMAEMEGEPAGFAAFSPVANQPGLFKLHKIYVLPNTQGTGLGKQLLSEVTDRCRQLGGTSLRLNVNRFNRARTFYEKQGFAVVGEEDVPIGPYWMNDFIMELPLTAIPTKSSTEQ